jgi:uncharacterized damage-inducible protein DinB
MMLSVTLSSGVFAQSQPAFFRNEFPEIWKHAHEYTLAVADKMEAADYSFKPVDSVLSFARHLLHIAENFNYLSSLIIEMEREPYILKDPENPEKEEIILILNQAFNQVSDLFTDISDKTLSETIKFNGEKVSKERLFYLMRDHCTHHRAQIIVYLRMKGIEPPPYVGW